MPGKASLGVAQPLQPLLYGLIYFFCAQNRLSRQPAQNK